MKRDQALDFNENYSSPDGPSPDTQTNKKSGRKRKRETVDEGERTKVLKTKKDDTSPFPPRAIGAKKRESCSEVNPDGKPGKKAKKKEGEEEEESSPKPRKRKAGFEDKTSETKTPKKAEVEPQEGGAKGPRLRGRAKGRRPNKTQSDSTIGRQTADTSTHVFQNHGCKDMKKSPGGAKLPDVIMNQNIAITYSKVNI
ncbi:UNVERIFIED_CONTAM: hypothetical protein FKN15_058778 [Acipenser sinensis]